jgi:hypothetical protein
MAFWKRQNSKNNKKSSGCQGFEGREKGMHRIFQGRETILYDTTMVKTWHFTFVTTKKKLYKE